MEGRIPPGADRATEVRRLRAAVVVQLRRLQEHRARCCEHCAGGDCLFVVCEQGQLLDLWRQLRALGDVLPEAIRT